MEGIWRIIIAEGGHLIEDVMAYNVHSEIRNDKESILKFFHP
jgi:hypothetical protein